MVKNVVPWYIWLPEIIALKLAKIEQKLPPDYLSLTAIFFFYQLFAKRSFASVCKLKLKLLSFC